jgi:hypothetical protein
LLRDPAVDRSEAVIAVEDLQAAAARDAVVIEVAIEAARRDAPGNCSSTTPSSQSPRHPAVPASE